MTSWVNGLGGPAGFGEFTLGRNDDYLTPAIDLSPIFTNGFDFFNATVTQVQVSNNGNVYFGVGAFGPFGGDVLTTDPAGPASPGGNSTGSNLVYYDIDTAAGIFTVTWDDVRQFNSSANAVDAFQVQIVRVGDAGSRDYYIKYIYEEMQWSGGEPYYFSNSAGVQAILAVDALQLPATVGEVEYHFRDNVVVGTAFSDIFYGDSRAQKFEGSAGADTINGGDGVDIVNYAASSAGVNVDLRTGAPNSGGDAEGDMLSGIENVRGSSFGDTLIGNDFNNVLYGNGGPDTISGEGGDDRITISETPVKVDGGGGTGDVLVVEAGGTVVLTDANFVSIERVVANDGVSLDMSGVTTGTTINSYSLAGSGSSITGTAANDRIVGGLGNDSIDGGIGKDQITLRAQGSVAGGADIDTLTLAAGVTAAFDDMSLTGIERINLGAGSSLDLSARSSAAGVIKSNSNANGGVSVIGSQAADRIYGGAGADTFEGGAGNDTFFAGSGAETFDFTQSGFGRDVVYGADLSTDTFNVDGLGSELQFAAINGGVDTLVFGSGGRGPGSDGIVLKGIAAADAMGSDAFQYIQV